MASRWKVILPNARQRRQLWSFLRPRLFKANGSQKVSDLDYQSNVGKAIVTLRDDLPYFFEAGLTNLGIYDDNILLQDPVYSKLQTSGRCWYQVTAISLKTVLKLLYTDISFEIVHMQQVPLTDHSRGEFQLNVRWIFEASPRAQSLAASIFTRKVDALSTRMFEGVFQYTFNSEGRIAIHKVISIHPAPPQFRLNQFFPYAYPMPSSSSSAAAPPSPTPTPCAPLETRRDVTKLFSGKPDLFSTLNATQTRKGFVCLCEKKKT